MRKMLSPEQVARFGRDGFVFPVRVMSALEAKGYRDRLEEHERRTGAPIQSNYRHKVHLLFTWANGLARHPRILDAVEDLLGPDLLCWTSTFFIKEANNPAFVSWHQDSTYWGLDPCDVVTAWVALSDAPLASGPMTFIPGSHRWDQVPHRDTFHQDNLLSRGQEIAIDVDESRAVPVPLKAGEISIHHVRAAHGSGPNTTGDRRIGLAIRYIPPHVRQLKTRDSAMLVRGHDSVGHYDPEPEPKADADAAAIAAHTDAVDRQLKALYSGTDRRTFRA
ncbi:MAG: phytanoyl-CoA dioxygenase family protein [Alphaproteobacteria bacterium]|nr:phytanoyl-CoA dioxygenase family protein [Alphaproteobacteria bacterium]